MDAFHRLSQLRSAMKERASSVWKSAILHYERGARWLRLICVRVFREPRLVWLTMFVLVLAIVPVFLWDSEFSCRFAGLVLQLFGLGTVALGIRKTRELFGRPGMRKRVVQWWRSRPRYYPSDTTTTMTGTGTSSIVGGGEVWSEAGPDAYIEIRLAALEKNFIEMRGLFNTFRQKTQKDLGKLTDDLVQEKQIRSENDSTIRAKLEEVGVGGLDISVMGIVWLFVGTIMSTLPSELAGTIAEIWRLLLVIEV
jgi:hypothetical protein